MKKKLISMIIWANGAILTSILFLLMLFSSVILYPFDKQRRIPHALCYWWSDLNIALNPYWKLRVSGLENIDHRKTYIIVANHLSQADIVLLYQTRMQFKWVAKDSLFKIPILGWCMTLGKHIELERGSFSSVKEIYREAAAWLRGGMSVLFFPEGTRSETGDMKEFQNGAFKLAIKEGVPVLPVAIRGTHNTLPKGSWLFNTNIILRLKVLPAIDVSGYSPADFASLRDKARQAINKV